MSMISLQTAIARLCVDPKLRESFLRDPDKAVQALDLTAEERRTIKALDIHTVVFYSNLLCAKRLELVQRWFPLSLTVLQEALPPAELADWLDRYGTDRPDHADAFAGDWVRQEIRRVYDYLQGRISPLLARTPYFSDLLVFEMCKLHLLTDSGASWPVSAFHLPDPAKEQVLTDEFQSRYKPLLDRYAFVESFRFNMALLIQRIEARQFDLQLAPEPTWILFRKRPQGSSVSTCTINEPTRDFLALCDGARTGNQILSFMAPRYASSAGVAEVEAKEACRKLLLRLYDEGAITFIDCYAQV